MAFATQDDIRQVGVIARNEFRKFLRGKNILLYLLLIGVFVVINIYFIASYPDVLESSIPGTSKSDQVLYMYMNTTAFLTLIGAVLFASYTIVSEFEERTYLLLFTRPIKKTTVFLGKFIACFMVVLAAILMYYGVCATHSLIITGSVSSAIGSSLLVTLFDIFAVTGMAMLFSTIAKRGSISALMTFFIILMVPNIIWGLILFTDQSLFLSPPGGNLESHWYLLNIAESAIPDIAIADFSLVLPIVSLFLWGIVPLVAAWIIFLRKEV